MNNIDPKQKEKGCPSQSVDTLSLFRDEGLLVEHRGEFSDSAAYGFRLTFYEIFAIFGIAEAVSTSHIGCIIFHIDRQLLIIEQQLALLLEFFLYGFFLVHCRWIEW